MVSQCLLDVLKLLVKVMSLYSDRTAHTCFHFAVAQLDLSLNFGLQFVFVLAKPLCQLFYCKLKLMSQRFLRFEPLLERDGRAVGLGCGLDAAVVQKLVRGVLGAGQSLGLRAGGKAGVGVTASERHLLLNFRP